MPASGCEGAGLGTPASMHVRGLGAGLGTPASAHVHDPRAGRPRGLASTHGHPADSSSPPNMSPPLPKRKGRRASVFAGARCTRTYYMGRPGGRRGSCGTVGLPASGLRATAIADHGPLLRRGRRHAACWGL